MTMHDDYLRALIDSYKLLDEANTARKRGPTDAGPFDAGLEYLGEMIGARFMEHRWTSAERDYFCLRIGFFVVAGFLFQLLAFGRLDADGAYKLAERLWERGFNFFGLAWPDD